MIRIDSIDSVEQSNEPTKKNTKCVINLFRISHFLDCGRSLCGVRSLRCMCQILWCDGKKILALVKKNERKSGGVG